MNTVNVDECATGPFRSKLFGLNVREVVVEFPQVGIVLLVVQSWEDTAAGELRQILERGKETRVC